MRIPQQLCVLLFASLVGMASALAQADAIALADLGDLELRYASLTATDRVPGVPLRAEVRVRGGEALQVLLPRTTQRMVFLVSPGQSVAAGDPVVRLEGPEIHHWQLEFEALADRFTTAKARYTGNEALYRSGALAADRWAAIQDSYLALSLEYEHMHHFAQLLLSAPPSHPEALLVAAPEAGRVLFDTRAPDHGEGDVLFTLVPEDALRLQVHVPTNRAGALQALQLATCQLDIVSVDQQATGYFVAAWSAAVTPACELIPGAVVSAVPLYAASALVVPRDAVFQWQRGTHVVVRRDNELVPQRVVVLADTEAGYAIADDPELVGREVLVTSVGAVQGLLMGLGGE